jgi:hypothetical protein
MDSQEILNKISIYEFIDPVDEGTHRLILVRECLSGKGFIPSKKFTASPHLPDARYFSGKPELWGSGDTTEEAIKNCLDKIKGIPIASLFESP